MNDTIREIIIKNFIARLSVITVAHEYATACGTHVFRARKTLDPLELPATNIIPGAEKAVHQYGELQCTMTIRIEGIAEFGTENPSVISERILGDLKKCILAPQNLLSSPHSGWSRSPEYIDSIIYTGGGTDQYPDENEKTIGAYANFDVGYTTKIENPCEQ